MTLIVHRAGFLTYVQDLGRPGLRRFGVPLGGALDLHALRVANLLVGNDESAAGLEITFGGLRLELGEDRIVAWTGGKFDVRVGQTAVAAGHSVLVRRGEELTIAAPTLGCRMWLAISGGINVPPVLGSRSTDWSARIGGMDGRALRDGDSVSLGPPSKAARSLGDLLSAERLSSWRPAADWVDTAEAEPVLRFVRGSDWWRFHDSSRALFERGPFTVTRDSNRMGARLEGSVLARSDDDADLISEAVTPGAVQVPPNGQPIVLLGDCQTIGGYPKIAHVITVDLSVAAQLRAGDRVRFQEVLLADAHRLLVERERDFNCFRTGLSLRLS